jgi:hypothetical protein
MPTWVSQLANRRSWVRCPAMVAALGQRVRLVAERSRISSGTGRLTSAHPARRTDSRSTGSSMSCQFTVTTVACEWELKGS